MTSPEPPKIDFPCSYPIKVLGRNVDDFHPTVVAVVERHAPGIDLEAIVARSSRAGTFVSLTIVIEATGADQLSRLHEELMATGLVTMVI